MFDKALDYLGGTVKVKRYLLAPVALTWLQLALEAARWAMHH